MVSGRWVLDPVVEGSALGCSAEPPEAPGGKEAAEGVLVVAAVSAEGGVTAATAEVAAEAALASREVAPVGHEARALTS